MRGARSSSRIVRALAELNGHNDEYRDAQGGSVHVRPAGRAGLPGVRGSPLRCALSRCRSRRGVASNACSDDLSSVSGCHRGGAK